MKFIRGVLMVIGVASIIICNAITIMYTIKHVGHLNIWFYVKSTGITLIAMIILFVAFMWDDDNVQPVNKKTTINDIAKKDIPEHIKMRNNLIKIVCITCSLYGLTFIPVTGTIHTVLTVLCYGVCLIYLCSYALVNIGAVLIYITKYAQTNANSVRPIYVNAFYGSIALIVLVGIMSNIK